MQLQEEFFDAIRKQLPTNKHLVDSLCELLSISQDSAYRRLRGETSLTFQEIKILSNHYKLSVDDLISTDVDSVHFQYKWIDPEKFNYTTYLESLFEDTKRIALFDDNEILFMAKDLPIFCNFLIPEIAEFKGFYWQKTALMLPSHKDLKFDLEKLDNKNVQLGYEIVKAYNMIPSTELWHNDVLSSLMSQISYYYDAGFFASDDHAFALLDKLDELVDHFSQQAELGTKFLIGKEPTDLDNYRLYFNDVWIGDNTLCLRTKESKTVYITQNIINNIFTQDEKFCDQTWNVQMNLIGKSKNLQENERERNRLFRRLKQVINHTRERLDQSNFL